MDKSFCIFIISHGRPDDVATLKSIARCKYTGPIFIVCDNEDETLDQYKENYGCDTVLVFDKKHYASLVDSCDNFQNRRTTTHARNACFDLAKERCFDFFLVLDDDYVNFLHLQIVGNDLNRPWITDFDKVAESVLSFLESDRRINSVCFMQGGDMFGGDKCKFLDFFPFRKRKAMNSFFCKTDRRFWFFSRLNEDVNTYMSLGNRGNIFITIPEIRLTQKQTQTNKGGMSDAYIDGGTYVKSFYTVMVGPSYCKVNLSNAMSRLHHKISWKNAIPKIISDEWKKQ
jgi:hypothetical protein